MRISICLQGSLLDDRNGDESCTEATWDRKQNGHARHALSASYLSRCSDRALGLDCLIAEGKISS